MNSYLKDIWTEDEIGRFRLRYCDLCRRMETQYEGREWFGYDCHGNWLGDVEQAAR